jgi:MoxR-like ATPase
MMENTAKADLKKLKDNLSSIISGKSDAIELLVIALCSGGNVLMEDVPGVGKTTMAKALALSIDGSFHRIQFTPDLLPYDIIGSPVYNPKDGNFHFRKGPIFTNILLADEINRASPRTQSALLEAMNEGQVTVEAETYHLSQPFLVIATENPIEYHGTYPLPEAQLDRFAMQIILGYPDEKSEMEMLYSRKEKDPILNLKPVINCVQICKLQEEVRKVDIEKSVAAYMVKIIRSTRQDPRIKLGASPRALLTLSRCSQAKAFLAGRNYVIPDDVKTLAVTVLAHRLVLENKAQYSGIKKQSVVLEIVNRLEVPA